MHLMHEGVVGPLAHNRAPLAEKLVDSFVIQEAFLLEFVPILVHNQSLISSDGEAHGGGKKQATNREIEIPNRRADHRHLHPVRKLKDELFTDTIRSENPVSSAVSCETEPVIILDLIAMHFFHTYTSSTLG